MDLQIHRRIDGVPTVAVKIDEIDIAFGWYKPFPNHHE